MSQLLPRLCNYCRREFTPSGRFQRCCSGFCRHACKARGGMATSIKTAASRAAAIGGIDRTTVAWLDEGVSACAICLVERRLYRPVVDEVVAPCCQGCARAWVGRGVNGMEREVA